MSISKGKSSLLARSISKRVGTTSGYKMKLALAATCIKRTSHMLWGMVLDLQRHKPETYIYFDRANSMTSETLV